MARILPDLVRVVERGNLFVDMCSHSDGFRHAATIFGHDWRGPIANILTALVPEDVTGRRHLSVKRTEEER